MGSGLYDLLGWGVLDPPLLLHPPEPDGTVWINDALYDAVAHLHLEQSCETEPDYLVIPLAVSQPFLQEYWKLPPLPNWCPRVGPRRARRVRSRLAAQDAHALATQRGIDLTQVWGEAQRIYTDFGLTLPAATLLVLNDWD
jgi:hypothetical protein